MSRIQILFFLGAAIAAAQESPRKLIASMEGKDLFRAYCASCHGMDAKGNGPVAPALKAPIPDLTTLAKRNRGVFPREEMEKMIMGEKKGARAAHGTSEMPVWGPVFHKVENDQDFALVRVRRLVEYLTKLQVK
jgi:mono/diheme cytochrome c family protein